MPSKKSKTINPKTKTKKTSSKAIFKKVVAKSTVKKTSVLKPKVARSSRLVADVYNIQGKIVSKIGLPKEVFGAKVNDSLMAQAVRVYLANQRMGTADAR